MTGITLSIPDMLYREMKRHPEARWSRFIKGAIAKILNTIEGEIPIEKLTEPL